MSVIHRKTHFECRAIDYVTEAIDKTLVICQSPLGQGQPEVPVFISV